MVAYEYIKDVPNPMAFGTHMRRQREFKTKWNIIMTHHTIWTFGELSPKHPSASPPRWGALGALEAFPPAWGSSSFPRPWCYASVQNGCFGDDHPQAIKITWTSEETHWGSLRWLWTSSFICCLLLLAAGAQEEHSRWSILEVCYAVLVAKLQMIHKRTICMFHPQCQTKALDCNLHYVWRIAALGWYRGSQNRSRSSLAVKLAATVTCPTKWG